MHPSTVQQIQAVREGLPYSSFVELKEVLKLNADELAQLLGISRRTLIKRQQAGNFSPSESNALSRVARCTVRPLPILATKPMPAPGLKLSCQRSGNSTQPARHRPWS